MADTLAQHAVYSWYNQYQIFSNQNFINKAAGSDNFLIFFWRNDFLLGNEETTICIDFFLENTGELSFISIYVDWKPEKCLLAQMTVAKYNMAVETNEIYILSHFASSLPQYFTTHKFSEATYLLPWSTICIQYSPFAKHGRCRSCKYVYKTRISHKILLMHSYKNCSPWGIFIFLLWQWCNITQHK
jgi:hypothetical protein